MDHDDHNHDDPGSHDSHDDHDGSDHSGHDMSMHEGMSPFLFTKTTGFFVLFQEANIQSTGAFVGALIASLVFATIATLLSLVMHTYEKKALVANKPLLSLFAAVLFGLRQLIHYIAMLIVMSMNVWLILVVVVGHAIGWLIHSLFPSAHRAKDIEAAVDCRDP